MIVALILTKGGSRKTKLPFGVFLALGSMAAWFFGEPLLARYRSLWP
jgi:prepilin signal peptidase PulO-like enzyme (type II secretory pathway)